jgi:hypothetical protein
MENYFEKLLNADSLGFTEMNEVINFFSPLIEKDSHSNNFNFICTEPNFSAINTKPFEIEPVLK